MKLGQCSCLVLVMLHLCGRVHKLLFNPCCQRSVLVGLIQLHYIIMSEYPLDCACRVAMGWCAWMLFRPAAAVVFASLAMITTQQLNLGGGAAPPGGL